MISRSLGPEFGGAVGLMFTLANAIAVSMYTIGFCESLFDMLHQFFPDFQGILGDESGRTNDVRLIGSATLIILLAIAIAGMNLVNKIQIGLLILLLTAQLDFFIGTFTGPDEWAKSKGFVGYDLEVLNDNL